MRELEIGMPVIVNGHEVEITEIGWRDEYGNYVSVRIEYPNGVRRWVPVKDLEYGKESIPTITAIRPRELFQKGEHVGRSFPTGSGGRIIDRSHPAYGAEVIVVGKQDVTPIRATPRVYYDLEVTEGPHAGRSFRMLGEKEKLWLEEPYKPEPGRFETRPIEVDVDREIPEGLPLSEVPKEQLPLFDHEQYSDKLSVEELREAYDATHPRAFSEPAQITDIAYIELELPPSYERVLNEIFGEERDYSREFPTPKKLGTRLGLRTKTAKLYMDTIRKEMRDKEILPDTEFISEEELPEEAYLEFWGIEDGEEKD